MGVTATDREPWHLDRRVPVATILVMVGHLVFSVWWITTLSSRVEDQGLNIAKLEAAAIKHEADARILVERHEARIRAVEIAQASQSSDLRSIQIGINRIEEKLEKMAP